MPPPELASLEKSPIEKGDLEGLQIDTRARETRDVYSNGPKQQGFLDDDFDDHMNYINEKQTHSESFTNLRSPSYPTDGGFSPATLVAPHHGENIFSPKSIQAEPMESGERRICGLKRRHFWRLFGLILLIVVVTSVVGGTVGGLQARNGHNLKQGWQTTAPPPTSPPSSPTDVLAGSPLNVVSYDEGGNGSPESRQTFRIYYQTVNGNIMEAVSNGWASWQTARPIFTDAVNYTGLATVSYLNGSQQQGSIFYVGMNGLVQEKRKILNSTEYWLPGTLNSLNLPAVGNITLPSSGSPDPPNQFDSYRMAAIYSKNFQSGAGIRLFYHAVELNGTNFIQEVVWSQSEDKWSKGAEIQGAWPNSHLAATIDDTNDLVRLFFSSGDYALQEVWSDMSQSPMSYKNGVQLPKFLVNDAADLAVTSRNGTTSVLYYQSGSTAAASKAGIHELMITGNPNSFSDQETFNLSEPLVDNPTNRSNYQPIAVANTAVPGLTPPQILAFWTDGITGNLNATSGYHNLLQASRSYSSLEWPTTAPAQIPLGTS